MRSHEFIKEAPIPDEWDDSKFKSPTSFEAMIAYAKERAKSIGTGSSRIAFEIPYQDRQTVLKVAKNRKGIAQNIEEISLLTDRFLRNIGIVIPIIDHDENEYRPTWLHTEKAEKISNKQLSQFLGGVDINAAIMFIYHTITGKGYMPDINDQKLKELHESELYNSLFDMASSFPQVMILDLTREANWGLYQGNPVILDIGFTTESAKLYGF